MSEEQRLKKFFEFWEDKHPELNDYTCWRMAKKNAKTFKQVFNWLRSEQDKNKIRVVAGELWTVLTYEVVNAIPVYEGEE